MAIQINHKYHPFSHEPGTAVLLPKSSWKVTAYPTRLEFSNLDPKRPETFVVTPQIEGPVKSFTVMQDLERLWVRVFGQTAKGYFSYRLFAAGHEIILFLERCPDEGLAFSYNGQVDHLKRKEEIIFPLSVPPFELYSREKMHFGCHKAQDWTLVKRRLSLEEILPIWFQLGKCIPKQPPVSTGTPQLLTTCKTLIEERNRVAIGSAFIRLFQASFEGIFMPRLQDTDHQGLIPADEALPPDASPLILLSDAARLIRALFIQKTETGFALLPCLPNELHAGRFTAIQASPELSLDLEWSKKMLRRVVLHPTADQVVQLTLPSPIASFRFAYGRKNRGHILDANDKIILEKGKSYTLDRFEK